MPLTVVQSVQRPQRKRSLTLKAVAAAHQRSSVQEGLKEFLNFSNNGPSTSRAQAASTSTQVESGGYWSMTAGGAEFTAARQPSPAPPARQQSAAPPAPQPAPEQQTDPTICVVCLVRRVESILSCRHIFCSDCLTAEGYKKSMS